MIEKEVIKDKIKELDEYFNSLIPYDYDNDHWDIIKTKYNFYRGEIEAINSINEDIVKEKADKFILEFKNVVSNTSSLKSEVLTFRERFIKNATEIGAKILKKSKSVWDNIKFVFAIPGITFASSVFALFFTLVFGTFLTWLFPLAYTEAYDGIVNAICALIIFLLIRIFIFKDVYLNQVRINFKVYLIKHFIAITFWWFIFYFIKYQEIDNIFSMPLIEEVFYLPYLVISGINHEYFITGIISYFVINIFPFIVILIYVLLMEKYYTNKKKGSYLKDSDTKIPEDYDYRFNTSMEVRLGTRVEEFKNNAADEENNDLEKENK